jgi:hypothetical protein
MLLKVEGFRVTTADSLAAATRCLKTDSGGKR